MVVGDESEPAPQAAPERTACREFIRVQHLRRTVPTEKPHVQSQVCSPFVLRP